MKNIKIEVSSVLKVKAIPANLDKRKIIQLDSVFTCSPTSWLYFE